MSTVIGLGSVEVPLLSRLWWNFVVFVRPWVYRAVAVGAAALSALILWGEVAVGFSAALSPLSFLATETAASNEFVEQVRNVHSSL